jgi:hypothetical protein
MITKLFGISKLLLGILIVALGIFILFPILKQNISERVEYFDIEKIFLFTVLEIYSLFLIYSGWTHLKNIPFNKSILIIGLTLGILIIIGIVSLLGPGKISGNVIVDLGIILVNLILIINDCTRLKTTT